MPGLKRHRSPLDTDQEDHSDSLSDVSKRQRLSQGGDSDDGSVLDDEAEVLYASQFAEQQQEKRRHTNVAAENGIIESVECVNFMCHKFLHVDIGPLINFIIGHNGSGKSAVLTALTISLGGKASATNRGGSLKSFIKEGEDTCTLIVNIKNGGDTGYQQDLYGSTIQVERTFNRSGASGFKLKSASGKVVSTKKGDLDEISDYYALQLDNPISVLTQDQARQFLSTASPSEKYKFFVKGVQLEQLYQDYEILADQIAQTEATFEDKKAHVSGLKIEMQRAKELKDLLGRQQEIRDRINTLAAQMAWSQVEDVERRLSEMGEKLRRHQDSIAHASRKVTEAASIFERAETALSQATEACEKAEQDKEPIAAEKDEADRLNEALKDEGNDFQRQDRDIKDELRRVVKATKTAKENIVEEQRRLEEIHGGSHARRMEQLEQSKASAERAKNRVSDHAKKARQLHENKTQAQQRVEEHKSERHAKQQQVQESESRIKTLQSSTSRKGAYPQGVDQLVKAIQREPGFSEKPIGPLADYVHLQKPVWSSVLERFFGGSLNGFVVAKKDDQQRLSNLMRRLNCKMPISIVPAEPINFSHSEPGSQLETICRILKVDHPWVLNHLIVNHSIEQHVLIENMNEAREVMYNQRLTNVKACLSIQTHDPNAGERFAYGADNSVSTSYMEAYKGIPRMKAQAQDQIDYESSVLQRHRQALRDHDEQHKKLQQEVERHGQALTRHGREAGDLKVDLQRADDEVEELQDAIDKERPEEGRLDALREGLVTSEAARARLERTYQECVVAKDAYLAKRKDHSRVMSEIDQRLHHADQQLMLKKEIRERRQASKHDSLVKKNASISELERLQVERDDPEDGLTRHLEMQRERVQNFVNRATSIGARVAVDDGETTESLDAKLRKFDKDLKRQEERIGGNREQILNNYNVAARAYHDALEQIRADQELTQLLKRSYDERRHRWDQFKKYITARARITFAHFLSERSFQGTLKIDHKSRLLDIHVQPDEAQKGKGERATKTLSGGEKSFSQICLLLSLWEAIGAPVRCLDEFDVFMDSVNREASMKLLIKAARDSVGRQFILITPQSMASINASNDIKIHKMRDPERNQGTLSFH